MRANVLGRVVQLPDGIELPLTPADDGAAIDLTVRVGVPTSPVNVDYLLDDAVRLHIGRGEAWVEPVRDLGPRAIEHYVVDHAVPTGLSALGDLIVHGAAVSRDGQAIALVGASGAGKSTTTAALAADGWEVLSDDAVRVCISDAPRQQAALVAVMGTYPSVRLHTDVIGAWRSLGTDGGLVAEYAQKARLTLEAETAHRSTCHRLVAIIVLANCSHAGSAARTPLGPAEASSLIAEQLFVSPASTSEAPSRLFLAAELAALVPAERLDFERSVAGVREAVGLVRPLGRAE